MDETVQLFGQHVEAELARCEDHVQREIRFLELLDLAPKQLTMAEFSAMDGADIEFIPSSKKKDSE